MELVLSLGLGRLLPPDADPESVAPWLVALVASGHTTLVREVIDLDDQRILEVVAGEPTPVSRWLDGAAAAAIVADVGQHYRVHGARIAVPPAEVQRLGVGGGPELALVLDGPRRDEPSVTLAPGLAVRAIDLDAALPRWTEKSKLVRRVATLLGVAKKHRLIVHSG